MNVLRRQTVFLIRTGVKLIKTGGCGSSLSPSKRRAGKEYSQSWCLFFLLRAKPVPKGHHDWEKILSSEMEAKTLLSQPWNIFRNRSFQLFLPSSSLVNTSLCLLLDLCSALWGETVFSSRSQFECRRVNSP